MRNYLSHSFSVPILKYFCILYIASVPIKDFKIVSSERQKTTSRVFNSLQNKIVYKNTIIYKWQNTDVYNKYFKIKILLLNNNFGRNCSIFLICN